MKNLRVQEQPLAIVTLRPSELHMTSISKTQTKQHNVYLNFFEGNSHYVIQANLELLGSNDPLISPLGTFKISGC